MNIDAPSVISSSIDDFGAGRLINRHRRVHQRGIVTSASLSVDMPGSEEAAGLSRGARAERRPARASRARRAIRWSTWRIRTVRSRNRSPVSAVRGVDGIPTHLDTHHIA